MSTPKDPQIRGFVFPAIAASCHCACLPQAGPKQTDAFAFSFALAKVSACAAEKSLFELSRTLAGLPPAPSRTRPFSLPPQNVRFTNRWYPNRKIGRHLLCAKDFADLACQLEIQLADAAHTVGIQIDYDFIPHVKPFRVMVHRFRHQRHARHVAKGRHEILAFERAMQLATL